MSWFVICVIPIAALAAFWMVHVMPEKIAHKNHHPPGIAAATALLLGGCQHRRPGAKRLAGQLQ